MNRRMTTVLVADDDPDWVEVARRLILDVGAAFYRNRFDEVYYCDSKVCGDGRPRLGVYGTADPRPALSRVASGDFDIAVIDYRWVGQGASFGLDLLNACHPSTAVVLTSTVTPIAQAARKVWVPKTSEALGSRVLALLQDPPGRLARVTGSMRAMFGG